MILVIVVDLVDVSRMHGSSGELFRGLLQDQASQPGEPAA